MAEFQSCIDAGCTAKHHARGLCNRHHRQWLKGRERDVPIGRRAPKPKADCEIRDCDRKVIGRGLCHSHSQQAYSFRIDATEFKAWVNATPGCMICGRNVALEVDHDHSCCDRVRRTCGQCNRGLLCKRCNWAIGRFHDDAELISRAVEYLRTPRA
jgi:hypothetical protein